MDLELIRRRHKWLTLIILVFIGAVFIFGMGSFVTDFGFQSSVPTGSAVEVNGEEISMAQYSLARENLRRQFTSQGQELPASSLDILNMRALNELIDYKLLAQKAKEMGFVVTDEEFIESVHNDPTFQIDGQFVGAQRYREFIEQGLNLNLTDFEHNYKERLLARKMGRFIGQTVVVTDEKLFNKYNLENEKANVYYVEFAAQDHEASEEPNEQEIKRHYDRTKEDYKTVERRTIRYIVFEPETFENNVEVSDEELNAYYNAYPEEFLSEEGNKIPYEEARDDVKANLTSQRAEIKRTEFLDGFGLTQETQGGIDQLAKDHGIGAVSTSAPFARTERTGDIPPLVVNKTYQTNQGNLSVVPVGASIWVIELSNIDEARDKTLEESKPEVIAAIKDQKANNQAKRTASKALTTLKSSQKETASDKAQDAGVTLNETGPFSRIERMPNININDPQAKTDIFEEVDEPGTVLPRVYEQNGKYYVLMLKEKISADPGEFELEKQELMDAELISERNEVLLKWLQNLRRQADIVPNSSLFPNQG
ncbi:MAG: SurA N-terminal domain-containing protein [Thermodesulfobacteriota bacterium]